MDRIEAIGDNVESVFLAVVVAIAVYRLIVHILD